MLAPSERRGSGTKKRAPREAWLQRANKESWRMVICAEKAHHHHHLLGITARAAAVREASAMMT